DTVQIAVGIPNLNAIPALALGLGHVVGDRVVSIACQSIDTRPHQEMGADLLGRAEELINVALTVADMNAARRVAQRCRGLPDVLQPADALLLLDRNARRVNPFLERCRSLE